jgi:hypothetical protein
MKSKIKTVNITNIVKEKKQQQKDTKTNESVVVDDRKLVSMV